MPDTISREELHEKIQRGDQFFLFEVLPRMYWRKHHLPGARSLPLDEVGSAIPTLVPDKHSEIVVYCWNFT
ncbi:MAG TPA: rhodanese-like domain-containing protein [Gemmatimonadaceae bacterium]|nr:rhodanese-like domain-containing protein [Gemmatimonadaceae bacterium]